MIDIYAEITLAGALDNGQNKIICDGKRVSRIEANLSDRADSEGPSFGVISNNAYITYNDDNQELYELYRKHLLAEGCQMKVYLRNMARGGVNKTQLIGVYYIQEIEYDKVNFEIDITLVDKLTDLQNHSIFKSIELNKTMAELLQSIMPKITLTSDAKALLDRINMKYCYLEKGTTWEQLDKICNASLSHIYSKNDTTIIDTELEDWGSK